MIDIENYIFDKVATAVTTVYSNCAYYSVETDTPSSFPCITMEQSQNEVYQESMDSSDMENHARITYEFNVYSNLDNGKKAQAKAIADIIDKTMKDNNFIREFYSPMPNIDRTIYRIILRYSGIVAKGVENGDNILYHIYRQ